MTRPHSITDYTVAMEYDAHIVLGAMVSVVLTSDRGEEYRHRLTWMQLRGMIGKLRRDGDARCAGGAHDLLLLDTCDGGLGVVLVGRDGVRRVARGHMATIDKAESMMEERVA